MLPELHPNQNVYIEISNLAHGGLGWEYGRCLWSPVYDRSGAEAWGIMKDVQVGDFVIHLAKHIDGYHWHGISRIKIQCNEFIDAPPEAGPWQGMSPYQRITLEQFQQIESPPHINKLFDQFETELKNALPYNGSFYIQYGSQKELRIAQKYLGKLPSVQPGVLYNCFDELSIQVNFNPTFNKEQIVPTDNEIIHPDFEAPGRVPTIVSRIIRDTKLVREIKNEYNYECQICGYKLALANGKFYCEGHHLKPLGGVHAGPDVKGNIILLCPTHHAEFDYGSIAIEPQTNLIVHINPSNPFNGRSCAYNRTDLRTEYLVFHFEKRFKYII